MYTNKTAIYKRDYVLTESIEGGTGLETVLFIQLNSLFARGIVT